MSGFALIILIMVLANGYILLELHKVSEIGQSTLTSDVQTIDRAKHLKGILFDEERSGHKFLVSKDDDYYTLVADEARRFATSLDSLQSIPHDIPESEIIESLRREHESLAAAFSRARENPLTTKEQKGLEDRLESSATELHEQLDRLIAVNQKTIDRSMASIERTTLRSVRVALILLGSALILAIGAAIVIASTITRPIKELIRGTKKIAAGSFQPIVVHSNDEMALLGRAVNDLSAKLKELEDLRTELMQHIAHELRTPLTTMLTAHYILSQQRLGPLNTEQLRLLNSIRTNIDKLTEFSYDFLDLAKIEAGMMQYNLEHTDLVPLVEPLVEEAKLTASRKGISLTLDASPTPEVLIDRKRFTHVVTNLLSNAIKYTEEDGRITVSLSPCDIGTRIIVRDTGVGIPQDDLPKIFEKFYRAKTADGMGTRGTGVGLALVKAVTEAFGGRVKVQSAPGVGSTFAVDLPAAPTNFSAQQFPKGSRAEDIGRG